MPDQFVQLVLHEGLGIRQLLVGENFVFGKGRSGTIQDLFGWVHKQILKFSR